MKTTDTVSESTACKIYGITPSEYNRTKLRSLVPHTEEEVRGRILRSYLVSDVITARKKKFESFFIRL